MRCWFIISKSFKSLQKPISLLKLIGLDQLDPESVTNYRFWLVSVSKLKLLGFYSISVALARFFFSQGVFISSFIYVYFAN